MEIRPLKEKEVEQARNIDSYCFDHDNQPERTELFFEKTYDVKQSLGIFDEDTLMSNMLMIPYTVRVRDTWIKSAGISSLATLPEFRQQGYVRKLLFHGLGMMKKKGQVLSVLGPFDYPFYLKFGWGLTYEKMLMEFPMEQLRHYSSADHSYQKVSAEDIQDMDAVYREYTRDYNAVFMRSLDEWRFKFDWQKLDHHHRYGSYDVQGNLTGIIHYHIKGDTFKIFELIYSTLSGRQSLLHFVYRHRAEASKVQWMNMPVDDPLILEIPDSRQKREIQSNMMARIVDIAGFFSKLSFPRELSAELVISVDDPLLIWNRAAFLFHWEKGKISVEKTDKKVDISINIAALSQIALGYMTAVQAWRSDRLQSASPEKVELLNNIFPLMTNYMNEIF